MAFRINDLVIDVIRPCPDVTHPEGRPGRDMIVFDCRGQSAQDCNGGPTILLCGECSVSQWQGVFDGLPEALREQLQREVVVQVGSAAAEPQTRQEVEDLERGLEGALAAVRDLKKGFGAS
jgi:hypothetical protein